MTRSQLSSHLTSIIGYTHLVYLGLLPSLATFGLLDAYGHPAPLLLLLGGAVAVGVYLAATFYYTPLPTSVGWSLLVLLDGPAWALLSIYTKRVSPLGFVVGGLLVDGTAIWLSVLMLALGSSRPVREQRTASAGFMLLALATTASLVWPYFHDVLWGQWTSLGWLGLGIFETLIVRFNQLERDEAARNPNYSPVYIVALLLIWVGSMIAGNVLHELALKATPQVAR